MSTYRPRQALIGLAACGILAAGALARSSAPASPVAGGLAIHAGPGGRTQLEHWLLRRDPGDRGLSRGWQRGGFAGAPVRLPNVVDTGPWAGRAGLRTYEGSVAWYRTSLTVSEAGTYAISFQSANFIAGVWLDGHPLGRHRGAYLPFELRAKLAPGTHTLVVRVDWRDPAAQARAGFHRTWFNWGGLDGSVEIRRVEASELSEATMQTVLVRGPTGATEARVTVGVRVTNHGPARTIVPAGELVRGGAQTVPIGFPALVLAHGRSSVARATVQVADPALWSPAAPNLYRLQLAVAGESSYSADVGLRQLTWRGGRMYLNGRRLLLHGATIQQDAQGHGDALTAREEDAIVRQLREIGANAARAQHPLDPALLERLDAAGILLWQGIGPVEVAGSWDASTTATLALAEQQARVAAAAAQLHPSIIAWNLVDEVARNGHDASEVAYVRTLTRWLHVRDPGRLVAVDVWGDHPPSRPGALYSDVDAVAETDYSGWYDAPLASASALRDQMRSRLAAMERTFSGKVLTISEFGADSNTLNANGAPGSYAYQSRLLTQHIAVYESDPQLSGMLIWLLRDYPLQPLFEGGSIRARLPGVRLIEGLNQKGLFTYAGAPKPAARVVARRFAALPRF